MRALLPALVGAVVLLAGGLQPALVAAQDDSTAPLDSGQRGLLMRVAHDTWRFFDADVDPNTHLPMDNIGLNGAPARGSYTSPTNIGVYFWSIVAAQDMQLIEPRAALRLADATLGRSSTSASGTASCSAGTTPPPAITSMHLAARTSKASRPPVSSSRRSIAAGTPAA
jgi:hypothetical protein